MQWLWLLLGILSVLVLLAHTRASATQWAVGLAIALVLAAFLQLFSLGLYISMVVVTCLCLAPLFAHSWRKQYMTSKLFAYMKSALPQMSQTEQEALAAGNTWWDAELFAGKPDWRKLDDMPYPSLSQEEQAFMDNEVQQLCSMLDDWDITHHRQDLSPEVWDFILKHQFFALIIPKSFGGLAFSAYAHSEIIQKISSRSLSAAVTVMVPNSLGPAELLLNYGTKSQKDYYLPRLASGEEIPCFALTAPSAGSDAGAIPDTGVVCQQMWHGEMTLGFKLNWEKRYITLGPVATLLGLAFHAYDPDHLLGQVEDLGITCALIPTNTDGVSIGKRHLPLNAAFMNGPNSGKDVFMPMDWLIGGQAKIGKGWLMLVERLAVGRGISLPSLSTGAAKHAVYTTYTYAHVRKQFHLSIAKFEGVEEVLARMIGQTYMMDAGRALTLAALDHGEQPAVITAIMKYYLTEGMRRIVNDAMDIHGGRGICMGPSNYLARMYQTIPVGITVEGANILTRTLIIFGQGSMRCHPFVQRELALLAEESSPSPLADFDDLCLQHSAHVMRNAAAAFLAAITPNIRFSYKKQAETAVYKQQLNQFSAAFATMADISLLLLGGALKRKEKLSGRFADALGHMYLCSAVLWKFEKEGKQQQDAPMMHWAAQHCLHQTQEALAGIIRAFPTPNIVFKIAALKMKTLVFPLGARLQPPADELGRIVVKSLADTACLAKLTAGIYQSEQADDVIGRLQHAYTCLQQSEPIEKRLKANGSVWKVGLEDYVQWVERVFQQGELNQQDKDKLLATHHATQLAIAVDAFPASTFEQQSGI